MTGASPELAVERSVRGQLYRESGEVKVTAAPSHPVARAAPHGSGPLGRLFGGRYRLLERVGGGGTATVYRARDERLKRTVAVKVIDERIAFDSNSVRRFRQEAELCARLAHPNVVAILDAGVEPRDFTVMEYVPGFDAGKRLRTRGRLTPGETIHVVAQVCEALAYAHEQDVVHQDVSPRNILIRQPDFTAKLADFGFAGTPGYIAPEILRGDSPSPRSDLYSLGVVAYRLLAGPGTTAPRRPPLVQARPGLPRRLSEAVQQALADEPDVRQGSVAKFRAQLVEPVFPDAVRGELSSAA